MQIDEEWRDLPGRGIPDDFLPWNMGSRGSCLSRHLSRSFPDHLDGSQDGEQQHTVVREIAPLTAGDEIQYRLGSLEHVPQADSIVIEQT